MARTIKLERTDERLTRRGGLILVNRFGDKIHLSRLVDRAFGKPGSNRGFPASEFVIPLMEMTIDGATHLEDIQLFEDDEAYKELADVFQYPSADAIGDWLRRHGTAKEETALWTVMATMIEALTKGSKLTLDIDGSFIAADKGDAVMTYKWFRGYHALLAGCTEMGLFTLSRFQQGNATPQGALATFVQECRAKYPGRFSTLRSDSAAYNSEVINYCFENAMRFSITADLDSAVRSAIANIPKTAWKQGYNADGAKSQYQVAECFHDMGGVRQPFRLVIKRTPKAAINQQQDFFGEQYRFWVIATNILHSERTSQQMIHFHEQRGEFERLIGELKHHYHLDRLPCGQFEANRMYFTIGILAFTVVQLLKQYYFGQGWKRKSVKSLRYRWMHIPSKIVFHARYIVQKLALSIPRFERFEQIFLAITRAPLPSARSG